MSRTIRRKNAWNRQDFIDHDGSWFEHMGGVNPFPYRAWRRNVLKYGVTDKAEKKLAAKFHSDAFHIDNNRGKKEEAAWKIRNKHKMELILALKNGEEENLFNEYGADAKSVDGWWWDWD